MSIEPCDTKYYGIIPCKKACCVVEEKMAARLQAHADMGLPQEPSSNKCSIDGGTCALPNGHPGLHLHVARRVTP